MAELATDAIEPHAYFPPFGRSPLHLCRILQLYPFPPKLAGFLPSKKVLHPAIGFFWPTDTSKRASLASSGVLILLVRNVIWWPFTTVAFVNWSIKKSVSGGFLGT